MEELTTIQSKIYEIRGQRVMLDFDLAALYQVTTSALNQAVKRNIERFPEEFMFRISEIEWKNMSSQFVTTSRVKRPKTSLPYAFTEQGVAMLSAVLRSGMAMLMIAGSNSETERENALIRLFRSKKVDGIIIAPADASGCEVGRLAESGCPVVLFDRCLAKTDAGCVVIDNEAGSHALVRHLAARGFRKIAIITTFPHLPTMELRHRGYLRALAEAGLHADPRLYGEVAYAGYRQHVCDTLDRILAMVPDTDGFFFTTHILATEALRYFHDRGIDISDGRLGLACMHEDPLFRLAAPRMSVARFPVEEISAHAVRLLLRQIRESQSPGSVRPAPESVVLPCRMEFRDE